MADRVQRLNFTTTPNGALDCYPHHDGGFVHYSDYAKLETELRDTRRALEMVAWGSERFWLDEARRERTEEIKGRLGE